MGSRGAPLERRSTTAGFASHASVPKPCPWPIFVPSIRINTFKIPYYRHTTDKKAVNSFVRSKKRNFAFSAPIRISIRMNSRIRLADPPSRSRPLSQRRHTSTILCPHHQRAARGSRDAQRVSRGPHLEDGRQPRPNPSMGGILARILARMPPWLRLERDWARIKRGRGSAGQKAARYGLARAALQWRPGGGAVAALGRRVSEAGERGG